MDKVSWNNYDDAMKIALEPETLSEAYAAGHGVLKAELSMLKDSLKNTKDSVSKIIKDIEGGKEIKDNDIKTPLIVINKFIDKDIARMEKSLTEAEGYVKNYRK